MIILKNTEFLSIVIDEKDLKAGIKNYMIMYQQRLYYNNSNEYRCTEQGFRPLYAKQRDEYLRIANDLDSEFEKYRLMFAPAEATPVKKEEPKEDFGNQLQNMMLKVLAEQSADRVLEMAKPMLDEHIKKTYGLLPEIHEVKTPMGTHEVKGVTHEKFDEVLNLVTLDIPVFLSGPAGTGKNVICKQIAEALGLEFYFTNAVTQEYKLTGFIDANGTYQETQFYKAFKDGGLFFLDEMDASIPEVLIILNAAIANRYFDFPNGKIEANENFRVIAAGNTYGTGADIEYSGRFQLDAASMDRFALVEITYSPKIEEAIANGNEDLLKFARGFRKAVDSMGLKHLFTYRSIERITKLVTAGMDMKEVLKISLYKGLPKDDLNMILDRMKKDDSSMGRNAYVMAS